MLLHCIVLIETWWATKASYLLFGLLQKRFAHPCIKTFLDYPPKKRKKVPAIWFHCRNNWLISSLKILLLLSNTPNCLLQDSPCCLLSHCSTPNLYSVLNPNFPYQLESYCLLFFLLFFQTTLKIWWHLFQLSVFTVAGGTTEFPNQMDLQAMSWSKWNLKAWVLVSNYDLM